MSDPKEQVRKDIRTYENYGKLRRLALLGGVGSSALAGYGAFDKKPALKHLGLLGAVGSGFIHGHSGREERHALNRVKKYYDLREKPKLINLSAILPEDHEKTAIVGSLAELIAGTAGMDLHHAIPFALDVAAIPWMAKHIGGDLFKNVMRASAKDVAGKRLTHSEKLWSGAAEMASGLRQKAYDVKGPHGKVIQYFSDYLLPLSKGQEAGRMAGKGIKMVEKVSPEHANLALKLIEGGEDATKATKELIRDKVQYQRALRQLSQMAGPKTKAEAEQTARSVFENYVSPDKVQETVKRLHGLKKDVVHGLAGGIGAATGFGVGSVLSSQRKKHPLAKDRLPAELAKTAFWRGFSRNM